MGIRFTAARAVSSVSTFGLKKVFRRPAGNFPGKMALYADPQLIAHLAPRLRKGSVLVVGTNGKTTVTNLIADVLERAGEQVICNRGGANLDSGIATALLQSQQADWGIFETDELWLAKVLPFLQCDYVLLLDLFHDQMDRITEIDLIQQSILKALAASPKTVLIYNADDPTCAFIARECKNASLAFGMGEQVSTACAAATEVTLCQCCDSLLEYDMRQYGQLGDYHCPNCAFRRPVLDFAAVDVRLGASDLSFTLKEPLQQGGDKAATLAIAAPCNAAYMVYNLSAVAATSSVLGCPQEAIQQVIAGFSPENGRLERYELDGRSILLNLAKNPVGFNQNINVIAQDPNPKIAAFFVNDKEGDGRDVSWLWNVDFESLLVHAGASSNREAAAGVAAAVDGGSGADAVADAACLDVDANKDSAGEMPNLVVFAGGMRANDVQVRLKYAGISARIVDDPRELLRRMEKLPVEMNAYVIGNYTALPALKAALDEDEREEAQEAENATASAEGEGEDDTLLHEVLSKIDAVRDSLGAVAEAVGKSAPVGLTEPIRIIELYGDLLSLFGDNGNAIVLEKRLAWRGIPVEVVRATFGQSVDFEAADLVLIGGSPDREQSFAAQGLFGLKEQLAAYVEDDGPLLAVDGSFQILGKRWLDDGEEKDGLALLDMHSCSYEALDEKEPAIWDIELESNLADLPVIGFENHAARTVLGEGLRPFGGVTSSKGCGNSASSKADGVLYRNVLGTYLHGPLLPKNPQIADYLLEKAIERHAKRTGDATFALADLDDAQEIAANKKARRGL